MKCQTLSKALLFVTLLLLSLLCAAQDIGRGKGVVLIGGDHNYPPYEFINKQGRPDGYNTEVTLAIAEVMGMEVAIQLDAWDTVRRQLEAGELDALQGIIASPERDAKLDFSPPHAMVHQSIFGRESSGAIFRISQLNGKEVIVQRGGIMHDFLLESGVEASLILVDTHVEALRLLSSGKHDYALVANLPGLYLGREFSLSNIEVKGNIIGALPYGYAVAEGRAELLSQFSEGLAILINTGRHQQIYDKWFGSLENPSVPWKRVGLMTLLVSLVLLVLLGGIGIWNRMLKREVKRRSEELEVQQQQLIQADKMKTLGVLVSGMAHEINNPTSQLLLNLPMLKEAYQDISPILAQQFAEHGNFDIAGLPYSRLSEELPLMLDDMALAAQRIKTIVDDLRDFARQEPGAQGEAGYEEDVALNKVVETAIRLVENQLRSSTRHFNVDYGYNLPTVKGHYQRIEQVIVNLIVNACQALTSVDQSIRVRTFHDQSSVFLVVEDEGCGIAEEHLSLLSDPFFTTKREQGGTGLGLSISVGILKAHGGSLSFESTPGKGAKATMTLPIQQDEPIA
ncbi:transporter substrate-binding domain-containing protein [Reinekea marinisedimentorum]|uniref:histidine kinase n=1 Tax=Reinekea marinisedimentorum TaxID=230495 RepID=A0A4R3I7C3_9GAMM|nr:transporter substrate-binding domain-containing protein [Reinekea marinisedimentorum]TCS41067.1 polar amino acid transport system substrate-binding protein [Reinekea marinisedimentorum]